jgi:hypothetical protein
MICQPTATRNGKRPNGPGRPGSTPPVAHWPAGQREQMRPRQSPGTGGSRRTLPPFGAGAHRARSRRRGLQMAMSVRPCPGCSAVPAGTAGAGLREQDRAEMVKRIRLCLDRTDICTVTRGVARECVSFDACYRCGGSGKVQPPPLLRSGICQSRTPAPARYRPAASDGSGSTAKTAIPHDHRHQPRHGGTSTTRFGAGHGSDVSLFWVDSVPGSGAG